MRILITINTLFLTITAYSQNMDEISTPEAARAYAANHIWAEVQVLPKGECAWIIDPGSHTENEQPGAGDATVVRNTRYKLIADTTVVQIQCSVIDFDLTRMSAAGADSVIQVMLAAYRRLGSFEKVVDQYLGAERKTRYVLFNEQSSVMSEIFGDSMEARRKGEIFVVDRSENDSFKFLVYMREDPAVVDAFIVLKTRLEE